MENQNVKEFVENHKISDDPITYRFKSEDVAHKFIKDRVEPTTNDLEKMSQVGLAGAEAGRAWLFSMSQWPDKYDILAEAELAELWDECNTDLWCES
jgi:hypothetical protein